MIKKIDWKYSVNKAWAIDICWLTISPLFYFQPRASPTLYPGFLWLLCFQKTFSMCNTGRKLVLQGYGRPWKKYSIKDIWLYLCKIHLMNPWFPFPLNKLLPVNPNVHWKRVKVMPCQLGNNVKKKQWI